MEEAQGVIKEAQEEYEKALYELRAKYDAALTEAAEYAAGMESAEVAAEIARQNASVSKEEEAAVRRELAQV